jgi:putative transposase
MAGRAGDGIGSAAAKGKAVRRFIRAAGAKLIFLPKYSPDLNAIKQVFAQAQASVAQDRRPRR